MQRGIEPPTLESGEPETGTQIHALGLCRVSVEKAQRHARGAGKFCFQFNGSCEVPGNNYLLSAHYDLDTILSAGIETKTWQGHALQKLMLVEQSVAVVLKPT